MTRLFRKRPVTIEARHVNAQDWDEVTDIARWCGAELLDREFFLAAGDNAVMAIETLEGFMYAEDGDWVIKGVIGEFYPCKPDVFQATYEAVA